MLKSIRQIEETEDALMCSKKLQIESLLNAYASLDEDKQAAIYNIDSLREINADVQVASACVFRLIHSGAERAVILC